MRRFRGGLVFKAQRLVYHSTLCVGETKKKKCRSICVPPSVSHHRCPSITREKDMRIPKKNQIPMAQGRSTKSISMNKWIRTSRLWIKNSPSLHHWRHACHLGLASAGVARVPLWCTWERRGDVFLVGQKKSGVVRRPWRRSSRTGRAPKWSDRGKLTSSIWTISWRCPLGAKRPWRRCSMLPCTARCQHEPHIRFRLRWITFHLGWISSWLGCP